MSARSMRLTASTLAVSTMLSACTLGLNPYIFNKELNTYKPRPSKTETGLAGGLDQALLALTAQRADLWDAAGSTEVMKNWTALGLLGLGAAGIYKGIHSSVSDNTLAKVGLAGAAIYGGASWLEPSKRQRIYLAGAMSLTCLALSTAAYEMSQTDFDNYVIAVQAARGDLESIFSILRTIGPTGERNSGESKIVSAAWKRAVFADRALSAAEETLGNIEKVGPRLRDLTALTASEVSKLVDSVGHDLSEVKAAIAQLKPDTNALMGTEIFALPKPEDREADAPADSPSAEAKDAGAAVACDPAPAKEAAKSEATKDATKKGTDAGVEAGNKAKKDKANTLDKLIAAAASAAASAAVSAAASSPLPTPPRRDFDVRLEALRVAMVALDKNLGPAISMTRRVKAARERQALPESCGERPSELVPNERSIAMRPGSSYQWLLPAETGKPSVQYMTEVLSSDVLDISLPLIATGAAVRLKAGNTIGKDMTTIIRIGGSTTKAYYDIAVKMCKSPPKPPTVVSAPAS